MMPVAARTVSLLQPAAAAVSLPATVVARIFSFIPRAALLAHAAAATTAADPRTCASPHARDPTWTAVWHVATAMHLRRHRGSALIVQSVSVHSRAVLDSAHPLPRRTVAQIAWRVRACLPNSTLQLAPLADTRRTVLLAPAPAASASAVGPLTSTVAFTLNLAEEDGESASQTSSPRYPLLVHDPLAAYGALSTPLGLPHPVMVAHHLASPHFSFQYTAVPSSIAAAVTRPSVCVPVSPVPVALAVEGLTMSIASLAALFGPLASASRSSPLASPVVAVPRAPMTTTVQLIDAVRACSLTPTKARRTSPTRIAAVTGSTPRWMGVQRTLRMAPPRLMPTRLADHPAVKALVCAHKRHFAAFSHFRAANGVMHAAGACHDQPRPL
ncbi:hypothetical protein AMAG_03267 [Allomyces macrogynus ATCC 38327]|uniref:Uncharacterized protein n=1 Tax=Allomyces macrogynus (strain ATCC 38327) TaxID=578462 RepID=A0A0L0S4Y3_ALLM3|nr:hypothetical protein AMAG_03267 [Allomyces macrogynus ATCC 38327]|eukprot:KNE57572.1 hypothetical protein AMAG_03267 [Allomyces macrogynus ATCC 38327]